MLRHKLFRLLCLGIVLLTMLTLCSCEGKKEDVYMFTSIEECEKIAELASETVTVEVYADPSKDKNIKDLKYDAFFGCHYVSEELSFELFAYEFPDKETAKAYYVKETGKTSDPDPTFSRSWGMGIFGISPYRSIVLSKNKVYYLTTNVRNKEMVNELITSVFSEKLFTLELPPWH